MLSVAQRPFSVACDAGRLRVLQPPDYPAGSSRQKYDQFTSRVRNDQVIWKVLAENGKLLYPNGIYFESDSATAEIYANSILQGRTEAVRSLLDALDDPERFVAAHLLLNELSQAEFDRKKRMYFGSSQCPYEGDADVARCEFDGLTVVICAEWEGWADLSEAPSSLSQIKGIQRPPAIDFAQRSYIRAQWRQRLDVPVMEVKYSNLLAATLILPAITFGRGMFLLWIRRTRRRRGYCLICGYNLIASSDNCSECGTPVCGPVKSALRGGSRRRLWRQGAILAGGVLLGIGFLMIAHIREWQFPKLENGTSPVASEIQHHMAVATSRDRMIAIGRALQEFEEDHDGDGPGSLRELVAEHRLRSEDIESPRDGFRFAFHSYNRSSPRSAIVVLELPSPYSLAEDQGIASLVKGGHVDIHYGEDATSALASFQEMNSAPRAAIQSTFPADFGLPGKGPQGPLFGDGGNARRIVFVCDTEGGMSDKMNSLKSELCKTVLGLGNEASFDVIFMRNDGCESFSTFVKADGLIPATALMKERCAGPTGFIRAIAPTEVTDPIPALQKALLSYPQLVYLLTDDEFPDNAAVLRKVKRMKKNHVKINTIALVTGEGSDDARLCQFLAEIAHESDGTFRRVKMKDLATHR